MTGEADRKAYCINVPLPVVLGLADKSTRPDQQTTFDDPVPAAVIPRAVTESGTRITLVENETTDDD